MWGLFVALAIIVLEVVIIAAFALLISGVVSWAANGLIETLKHLKF
jgi:hypothetical protein